MQVKSKEVKGNILKQQGTESIVLLKGECYVKNKGGDQQFDIRESAQQ